jgi:ADP-ribosyl-[dinitrogen reductase] hydrolase
MTSATSRMSASSPAATARMPAERVRGMVLGGALGDALGGPVEFLPIRVIRAKHGPDGITTPQVGPNGLAEITDDTQMTLFTLEGLIRAHHYGRALTAGSNDADRLTALPVAAEPLIVPAVHAAYLRWLWTQRDEVPHARLTGWLITHDALRYPRAPGNTCLTALRATSRPDTPPATITHRINTSKGCGAVMRAAPAALWPGDADTVFRVGVDTAALTHSHPTGFLAAGTMAVIVRELLHGAELHDAIEAACALLRTWPEHDELLASLQTAVRLGRPPRRRFTRPAPPPARLAPEDIARQLGGGWSAEQALAIAVYAALCATDFAHGVRLAVNHSGDSDSTGAITGNLLGAHLGIDALPQDWLATLELRDVIDQLARDALIEFTPGPTGPGADDPRAWHRRYPID